MKTWKVFFNNVLITINAQDKNYEPVPEDKMKIHMVEDSKTKGCSNIEKDYLAPIPKELKEKCNMLENLMTEIGQNIKELISKNEDDELSSGDENDLWTLPKDIEEEGKELDRLSDEISKDIETLSSLIKD